MRRFTILLVMVMGCAQSGGPPPASLELDLEALAGMEAPARMEALSAWAVVARENGTLGATVGAAQVSVSPGASQELWGDVLRVHVLDSEWDDGKPKRSMRIAASPQHLPWYIELPAREIPISLQGATSAYEIPAMWPIGCTTIRAMYQIPPRSEGGAVVPAYGSDWSNEKILGDCISPPPTPVPEPGGLALLSSGFAALWIFQIRRSTQCRKTRLMSC